MQNFFDQASKNGVSLSQKGSCQFCGGAYTNGIFECMENYNKGLGCLDLHDPLNHMSVFLSVDAHALQHPEVHGRWSNHFHLTRLDLLIDKKQDWTYKKSPLLSDYLNAYKKDRQDEVMVVPDPMKRGRLTSLDLARVTTAGECRTLVRDWAYEVYQAWQANHALVGRISLGFLNSGTGRLVKIKS